MIKINILKIIFIGNISIKVKQKASFNFIIYFFLYKFFKIIKNIILLFHLRFY